MESTTSSGGIGFFGLLAVVFVVLRLTHVIAWSWLWVLAPLWIPTVLVLVVLAVLLVVALVADRR